MIIEKRKARETRHALKTLRFQILVLKNKPNALKTLRFQILGLKNKPKLHKIQWTHCIYVDLVGGGGRRYRHPRR
jgi:hypothetical protein